jgi:hypothetical protein
MPRPPIARKRRRSRKRVLYDYVARWHKPGLGLDLGEWMHMEALGYGERLARGQLTDAMTVALLEYTHSTLEDDVVNLAPTWSERLARIIEALMQRRIRPEGLTAEEIECLRRLAQLENEYGRLGGDRLREYTSEGRAMYEPPPEPIVRAYADIRQTFPVLMMKLEDQVRERLYSTDVIKLGRYAPMIQLGQRSSAVTRLAALRADLGKKYLDPNASAEYRRACVRKWKQLALARAAQNEAAHRALLEHNRRVREAHRNDLAPPADAGAFLIV